MLHLAGRPSLLGGPAHRLETYLAHETQPAGLVEAYQEPERPVRIGSDPLVLGARNVLAVDLTTGQPLFAKNSQQPVPIASITKLASVLVIVENHRLDEAVTIPTLPVYGPADSRLGLVAGQRFKLADLLKASLIPSDNDAMDSLAIYDSGSTAKFVAKMNQLVKRWGIDQAHFSNPTGLVDQNNSASAAALSKIARLALVNPTIGQFVAKPSATISDLSGQSYNLVSTNQLLQDHRFSGIKTGYTPAAGQSLIALSEINDHKVIVVVLGSPDRFGETQTVINWIGHNFKWL